MSSSDDVSSASDQSMTLNDTMRNVVSAIHDLKEANGVPFKEIVKFVLDRVEGSTKCVVTGRIKQALYNGVEKGILVERDGHFQINKIPGKNKFLKPVVAAKKEKRREKVTRTLTGAMKIITDYTSRQRDRVARRRQRRRSQPRRRRANMPGKRRKQRRRAPRRRNSRVTIKQKQKREPGAENTVKKTSSNESKSMKGKNDKKDKDNKGKLEHGKQVEEVPQIDDNNEADETNDENDDDNDS